MTQAGFKEFWEIAQHWRTGTGNGDLPGPAAREYHRAVKRGVDEQRILKGAQNYDKQGKPGDPQYQMSAVKWLLGWGWEKYADMQIKEWVPLSPDERRAWMRSPWRAPETKLKGTEFMPPEKFVGRGQ